MLPTINSVQIYNHIQNENEEIKCGNSSNWKSKQTQSSNIYIRQNTFQNKDYYKRQYIMIKESNKEGDITIINIHTPNIGVSQYIWQSLRDIKGDADSKIIKMGDFKNSRKSMERSSTQKVSAGLKWHIRAKGANLYININVCVCV